MNGAADCCIFQSTALFEFAMHYSKKITIKKQILCRFQKKFFFKDQKIETHLLFLDLLRHVGISLSWKPLVFGRFTSQERTNVHRTAFFLHTPDFSLSKVTALKVVWGKDTSRRSKKPGSDLPLCFSAWAPFYKCGWRHHISRFGCGPDCFMQKLRVCTLCSSLLTYKREMCLICIPLLLMPGWT